jgi:hypothetical protein
MKDKFYTKCNGFIFCIVNEKKFMRNLFVKYFIFCILIIFISCKKNSPAEINPEIIGEWSWVYAGLGNNILADQTSGIHKTLVFYSDGSLIVTHNDSTSPNNLLQVQPIAPKVLFPVAVTDTVHYSFISQTAACVGIKFPFLKITNQYGYQYSISNDTLTISLDPCLAPFITVYIKSKTPGGN